MNHKNRLKSFFPNREDVQKDHYSTKHKYSFNLFWPNVEPLNRKDESVDVKVNYRGKEYTGSLSTLLFVRRMFKKNAKITGECSRGSYFCMPNMIIVKDLHPRTIINTIDDLIERKYFDGYFKVL